MAGKVPIEESLLQLLKCVVCLEQVEELKALPCQHTICLDCVLQLTVRDNRFKCPTCNKEIAVPNGGFVKLPNSLVSKQIADIIGIQKQSKAATSGETIKKKQSTPTKLSTSTSNLLTGGFGVVPTTGATSLLTSKGGFGVVPATNVTKKGQQSKDSNTSHGSAKTAREKQGNKIALKSAARVKTKWVPSEADVSKLKKELQEAYDKASKWLTKAEQTIKQQQGVIPELTKKSEKVKSAINKYQKQMCTLCEDKSAAADKGAADKEAELRQSLQLAKTHTDKMEAAIRKVKESSKQLQAMEQASGTTIAVAQHQYFQLKALNAEVRRLDLDLDNGNQINSGDCVRFMPVGERFDGMEELLKGKVSHSSVGVFQGMKGSKREHVLPGINIQQRMAFVLFPENPGWTGSPGMFERVLTRRSLPFLGDKVRVKSRAGDESTHDRVGVLTEISQGERYGEDCDVEIEFSDDDYYGGSSWCYSQIELMPGCPFQVGDEVRVSSTIPEPSRGWGGVTGSSIGEVVSIDGDEGNEEITVDFAECHDWIGSICDLEMNRRPVHGDAVQVKLSVDCSMLENVTHKDVGIYTGDVCNYGHDDDYYFGPIELARVTFPNNKECQCNLGHIERARYQTPSYDLGVSEDKPADAQAAADIVAMHLLRLFGHA